MKISTQKIAVLLASYTLHTLHTFYYCIMHLQTNTCEGFISWFLLWSISSLFEPFSTTFSCYLSDSYANYCTLILKIVSQRRAINCSIALFLLTVYQWINLCQHNKLWQFIWCLQKLQLFQYLNRLDVVKTESISLLNWKYLVYLLRK